MAVHRLTKWIHLTELRAVLTLLVLGFVVIGVIEDKVIDPWGIFNPYKFGLIILTLASLEFASYLLSKMLSAKHSALIWGLLGGLVSSTAVLLASVRRLKNLDRPPVPQYIAIVASQSSSMAELLFIVGMLSPQLLFAVAPPVMAVLLSCAAFLLWSVRRKTEVMESVPLRSPLDWRGVIRLAVVFAIMLAAVAIAQRFLGKGALLAVSILGGSFELHGITLANATMEAREQMDVESARINILAAISASFTMKSFLGLLITRNRFGLRLAAIFAVMIALLWIVALAS